jgi:two-component system response regulator HydG
MSAVTLGILLLSMGGSLLFIRRITKPVVALSRATQRIDKGEVGVRVQAQGEDEFGTLGTSFNRMVTRMETYTRQLEEQTMELERAHQQTRTFCGIVQEIGSLGRLNEIGAFLIKKFQGILKCDQMVLLVYNGNRDLLFALSAMGANALRGSEIIQTSWASLEGLKKITFSSQCIFQPPLVPDDFQSAARQAIIPFLHENEPIGALVVACPKECRCKIKELEIIGLTLTQAAGGIKRAIFQEEEIRDLQSRLETSTEFSGIVGKDPKMQLIYKLIEDIAPTDATVLIQGESGTGKELVARAIHRKSLRKNRPFVVLNCSAYPATLLESELFGHEKGAFTGAIRKKPGRFEQAHGGTIFLDEIGDIAASAQIRLLRVLQTKKFERLGGEQTQTVDVRILAATNKNLEKEVKGGQFREDLYYRLNVIPIHLPALRERRNDIPLLSRHFLRHFASEQGKDSLEFSPEAMRRLLGYSWPGNVRELENSAEHAAVLSKGDRIEITDLPAVLHTNFTSANARKETFSTIVENEIELVQQVLEECGWNKKQAAQRLGISRSSLYEKLKKYKITRGPPHIRVIK